IDTSVAPVLENLKAAAIGIDEASYAIRDYLDRLEADPARLDRVESRLDLIDRLKRKYGSSVMEILEVFADVRAKLEAGETAGGGRLKGWRGGERGGRSSKRSSRG